MNSVRTLILDDHQPFRMVLKNFLARFGFVWVVTEAGSAEDGLESMKRYSPDLAIVDVHLPGMNGFDFTRLLKLDYPKTKVIFVSFSADEGLRREAERLGHPYITKDRISNDLPPVIESLTNGKRINDFKFKNNAV
jgi:DNA-binding NarL/FixJ family response regulator